MLSTNKIYDNIIDYLSNLLTHKKLMIFEQWLQSPDENRELFEKVEKQWNSFNVKTTQQKETAWKKLSESITERHQGFIKRNAFSVAVAAVLILLIASGWFIKTTTSNMVNIATNENTFKRDTLENGSIVFLYPSSTIEVVKQSAFSNEQIIKLTGEAFFIIPPNTGNNVKINVGGASIKVTGTSFKVSGYDNQIVSVIVESGQVILKEKNTENKQLVVQAGEQGYFINANNKLWKKVKTENIYLIYQPVKIN